MKKKLGFLICFLSCFILISCNNFFGGNDFIEDLNSKIKYNTLQQFNINVTNLHAEWGTITAGAGNHSVRVTDTINLQFEVKEGYRFLQWNVVNKEDSVTPVTDVITFDNKYSAKAVATINEENDSVIIIPECCEIFGIKSFYPDGTSYSYPKNTSISITFNLDLPEDIDLSLIDIDIEGLSDSKSYFNSPCVNGNQIYFNPNPQKMIPLDADETKKATVTIPENFSYTVNGIEYKLPEAVSFSYIINSETVEKVQIIFINSEDTNSYFTANNVVVTGKAAEYSIGEKIALSYLSSDGYLFKDFDTDDIETITISKWEYNVITKTYDAIATVLNLKDDVAITVKPVVEKRKQVAVHVAGNNGNVTPIIDRKYYEGEEFSVSFDPDDDYAFLSWSYSLNENSFNPFDDNSIIQNLKNSSNADFSELKFKVNTLTVDNQVISFEASSVKRPEIISHAPLYDSKGVFKDRKLLVMFDKVMSKYAIYFTPQECQNIVETQGYTLLDWDSATDPNFNKNYYYRYKDEKNNIIYKNIKITKYTDENDNFLEFFGKPYFDEVNPLILRIPVNSSNVPPSSEDIEVTIMKGFFYEDTVNNLNLTLNEDYKFTYHTSNNKDNILPVFGKHSEDAEGNLTAKFKNEKAEWKELSTSNNNYSSLNDKIIQVRGSLSDEGSGPAKVEWIINKVEDVYSYYPLKDNSFTTKTGTFKKFIPEENLDAVDIFEEIDLNNIDLIEGEYSFSIRGSDNNDNYCIKTFYFLYDKTPSTPPKIYNCIRTRNGVYGYWDFDQDNYKKDITYFYGQGGLITDEGEIMGSVWNVYNYLIQTKSYKATTFGNLTKEETWGKPIVVYGWTKDIGNNLSEKVRIEVKNNFPCFIPVNLESKSVNKDSLAVKWSFNSEEKDMYAHKEEFGVFNYIWKLHFELYKGNTLFKEKVFTYDNAKYKGEDITIPNDYLNAWNWDVDDVKWKYPTCFGFSGLTANTTYNWKVWVENYSGEKSEVLTLKQTTGK